jgi:hypothetical protein
MKTRKQIIFGVVLGIMACMAGALVWLRAHQRLGQPGIIAAAIADTSVLSIDLPEQVLDFTSTNLPTDKAVLDYLPKDTSYAHRYYTDTNGFGVNANIILMGADRTSIHKPDYCLPGHGMRIYSKTVVDVPIGGAQPYTLPVAKWSLSEVTVTSQDGQTRKVNGIYMFWFVAEGQSTPSHFQFRCRLFWDLLRTGVLGRWAYVSYFSACEPGQEEMAAERMKQLIAASVPEFQLPPAGTSAAIAVK